MQSHGTALDGRPLPVHKPTKLLNGQTVQFGGTRFVFSVITDGESSMSAPASAPSTLASVVLERCALA